MNALALLLLVLLAGSPASPVAAAAAERVAFALEVATRALPDEPEAERAVNGLADRVRAARRVSVPRWRCPSGHAWPAPRAPTAA